MKSMKAMGGMAAAVWLVAAVLSGAPAVGQDGWLEDTYTVQLDADGNVTSSGGTGYNGGEWYYYPLTGWANVWLDNKMYRPYWWKEVEVRMLLQPVDPSKPARATVIFNLATPPWEDLQLGRPPLPSDLGSLDEEELYITRLADRPLFDDYLPAPVLVEYVGQNMITLRPPWGPYPTYNPRWLSLDIVGYNAEIVDGWIRHRCIPEPATIMLLAASGLLLRRRRVA